MLRIQPNPTFEASVEIPVPGVEAFAPIKLTFRHKGREALNAWLQAAKDRQDADWLGEVIAGWSGVTDADGAEQPYSLQALGKVLDTYPASGTAIFEAYLAQLTQARRGN